jgi:hypothetical protein
MWEWGNWSRCKVETRQVPGADRSSPQGNGSEKSFIFQSKFNFELSNQNILVFFNWTGIDV